MSFLDQLCKKKNSLKTTATVVTQPDGRCYIEGKDFGANTEISQKSYGFVVDTKPDNIPAQITQHVYLGSQDCCDLEVLTKFNISRVLSIGIEPPCVSPDVIYKCIKCLDLSETNIVTILENDCLGFMGAAVDEGRNILVHCNAGVSRSSAIVLGYLMLVENLSYHDAYNVVKLKRSCIKPNEGFEKQLRAMGRT